MAEKLQDAEDRLLESMFQSEEIANDGFSDRTLRRIKRQIWVRRLALPIAMVVGAVIAVRPALELLSIGSKVFAPLANKAAISSATVEAQVPLLLIGGLAIALIMATFRLFEE
jgi:hypothetical protein